MGINGPADISSLALWLDAGQISGAADGSALATWPDMSGNGRDATATGSLKPTFQSTGTHLAPLGTPVVTFDGVTQFMATGAFAVARPFTALVVNRWLRDHDYECCLSGASGSTLQMHAHGATGTAQGIYFFTGAVYGRYTDPAGAMNIYSQEVSSSQVKLSRNSVSAGAVSASTADVSLIRVGADTSASGDAAQVSVAEILLYGKALSSGEMIDINNYLTLKHVVKPSRGFRVSARSTLQRASF
jgi:hypothetical protein